MPEVGGRGGGIGKGDPLPRREEKKKKQEVIRNHQVKRGRVLEKATTVER